jgi:hypothetical protein
MMKRPSSNGRGIEGPGGSAELAGVAADDLAASSGLLTVSSIVPGFVAAIELAVNSE